MCLWHCNLVAFPSSFLVCRYFRCDDYDANTLVREIGAVTGALESQLSLEWKRRMRALSIQRPSDALMAHGILYSLLMAGGGYWLGRTNRKHQKLGGNARHMASWRENVRYRPLLLRDLRFNERLVHFKGMVFDVCAPSHARERREDIALLGFLCPALYREISRIAPAFCWLEMLIYQLLR